MAATPIDQGYIDECASEDYIQDVLNLLPSGSLLPAFARVFLQSMSLRTLQSYAQLELKELVQERFAFFEPTLLNPGIFRLYDPPSDHKTIFECVYPDATFLVMTLEGLFEELGIKVKNRFHPVVGIIRNEQGQVIDLKPVTESSERLSIVYIECERLSDEALIERLLSLAEARMQAVQASYRDQSRIQTRLKAIQESIACHEFELTEPKEEWINLLDWLKNPNFSFFGYVAFLANKPGEAFHRIPETGLGILAPDCLKCDCAQLLETLTAHLWRMRSEVSPFIFDVIKVNSPIQRVEPLMRLSLKLPGNEQQVIEHNFLGLLRRSSLHVKNIETPLIHLKMKYIFQAKNLLPDSHNYNEVIRIFSAIPKYELFRTPAQLLLKRLDALLSINDPHQIYCFAHKDLAKKRLHLMVVLPSALLNRRTIQQIVEYLRQQVPHSDYEQIAVPAEEKARLHLYLDLVGDGSWTPDVRRFELEISELVKPWEQKIRDLLTQQYGSAVGSQLSKLYLSSFPNHYRARSTPEEAIRDINFLEKLAHEGRLQTNLTTFVQSGSQLSHQASLLYVYSRDKIDLITLMPVLENMGLYVLDQLTTRVATSERTLGFIQSFRVTDEHKKALDEKRYRSLLGDLLLEIFNERTENDPLNALALKTGLDWRAINLLQLYRNLYLQLGAPFSRTKLNGALLNYPQNARLLFETFETKFSTASRFGDLDYRKKVLLPALQHQFLDSLHAVQEVADDIILRRLFNLIEATLRTNFYIPKPEETFISIKLDSRSVEHMPVPTPYREIYVHDAGFEGTHLRFGTVARGGIRWSDRPDDFRTEVLGLVKTQQTKNVVIVPVGSKGGFVLKKSPPSRDQIQAEGQKQYRKFIAGLLDITDNLDASGQARHPNHVLVYDELDPYLVVAADKGTATFSDLANDVSQRYRFWLGDAFASGGSVGYDHKKEGITARGAFECVKLHFKEMGRDILNEVTTVAGIGDMAGDVFGNGMLLSKTLKLRAVFNHVHIFLDPDPDPLKSWEERRRLFYLPRSTWKDYAADLISPGGGVFDRKAKEIRLSPAVKQMLEVTADVLTGEEVMKAILKMKVDLFWFGGIGTYIKAPYQTHMQVGDQANDSVRIDAPEVKALVIAEGANLGWTQLARIEFNKTGGRINTDAIDNSAGVNMSDYEVNIKILLQQMLQEKVLGSMEERNQLLAAATNEVSALLLANNRGQHRLISMDTLRSLKHFKVFRNLINYLVDKAKLNARSEYIPNHSDLEQLEHAELPFPRPVLAVLQAYVKMRVYDHLLLSPLPADPALESVYRSYFPPTIVARLGEHITHHPLKKEIVGTLLTNRIINQAGSLFFYRTEQITGKAIAEVAQVYLIFDASLEAPAYREAILNAANVTEAQKYQALIELEDLLELLTQQVLQMSSKPAHFAQIERYRPIFQRLKAVLGEGEAVQSALGSWMLLGFTEAEARLIATVGMLGIAPDVLYLHEQEGVAVETALQLAVQVNQLFGFEWLKQKVQALEPESDWELSHQDILLQTLKSHKFKIIRFLLRAHTEEDLPSLTSEKLLGPLEAQFAVPLGLYFQTLNQLKAGAAMTLTSMTVGINRLNFLELI